jgi:hypothetical protein
MSKDEANSLRLTANEIIRLLFEAGERTQIEILCGYSSVCLDRMGKQKPAKKSAK